jgi:hypothetical protein
MGVSVPVAERILNHSLGWMLSIYDQHDMLDERRLALNAWAEKLISLESGAEKPSNVISMQGKVTTKQ